MLPLTRSPQRSSAASLNALCSFRPLLMARFGIVFSVKAFKYLAVQFIKLYLANPAPHKVSGGPFYVLVWLCSFLTFVKRE